MNWNNLFTYDDGKLVWKVALGRKIRIGDPAGTMTPRGYVTVTYQGKKYRAHRIIWEMLKGAIPVGMEVDHGDGDRTNNRISNLSLRTNAGNHMNMAKRKDNTSGATGVYQCKVTGKWKASAKQNGVTTHLGTFECFDDAVAARKAHNLVVGFSDRHGT